MVDTELLLLETATTCCCCSINSADAALNMLAAMSGMLRKVDRLLQNAGVAKT
jgi:hypothetical protein